MAAVIPAWVIAGSAWADGYTLALKETGKRDYYCTVTIALTNETAEPLTEINAFFLNFIGDTQVGRSKGASFLNVGPGETATATFETPNAPCAEVDSYHMVIGACRLGIGFDEKAVCVERMRLDPPFAKAAALN